MTRVLWVYDRSIDGNPFLKLALETISSAGLEVTLISSGTVQNRPFRSLNSYSFERRQAVWERAKSDRNRLADKVTLARQSAKRAIKAGENGNWPKRAWAKFLSIPARFKARYFAGRGKQKRWSSIARDKTIETWIPYLRAFRTMLGEKSEIVIGSRPQSAFWAAICARLWGARLVYYPFELHGDQSVPPSRFSRIGEFVTVRLADQVITQNDKRAEVYTRERGARRPPAIVHNYKTMSPPSPTAQATLRQSLGFTQEHRIALYEGHLIKGRWLERLIECTKYFPEDLTLVLMGPINRHWKQENAEAISRAETAGKLRFHPAVAERDVPQVIRDADVGIIIYDDRCRNNVFCEPGKMSDYLAAGVPIVAPDFPTIGQTIASYGIGLTFESSDPRELSETIIKTVSRGKAQWQPAIKEARGHLTWASQVPSLLEAVLGHSSAARYDKSAALREA